MTQDLPNLRILMRDLSNIRIVKRDPSNLCEIKYMDKRMGKEKENSTVFFRFKVLRKPKNA